MKQQRESNIARAVVITIAALLVSVVAAAQPLAPNEPSFTKALSPTTIGPGSRATLTYTIDNPFAPGPPPANYSEELLDFNFTDVLPAGVTIATPAAAFTNCRNGILTALDGGNTITLAGARLGTPETCTVTVDVTASTPTSYTFPSTTLNYVQPTWSNSTISSSASLTVSTGAAGFTKSFAPSTVFLGETSTLTFTIDNSLNTAALSSSNFTDIFPDGMRVASPTNASTTCTLATFAPVAGANSVALNLFSLAAGATCTATVDVVAGAAGRLVNRTLPFTNSGFASAALDVSRKFLSKSFIDDPAYPGGPVTVEYTILNFNRGTASAISFTDDFNAALTGLAVGGPLPATPCGAGSTLSGTTTLSLTGGTLAAGGTCTFAVPLMVPIGAPEGTYLSTTSPVSTSLGPQSAGSDSLIVKAVPLLTKNFLTDPATPGSTINLEFTITNPSFTSDATAITFTDDFTTFIPTLTATPPATGFCGAGSMMSFFPANPTQGARITVTGANLLANTSCTFPVPVTIPADTQSGIHTNATSTITGTISAETRVGPAAVDTLKVLSAPRLAKAFINDPAPAGGTVTLQFTLSHSPNVPDAATGITFTDDLGATLTGLVVGGALPAAPCGAGSVLSGTSVLTLTGGSLPSGGTCTFAVTLQVPAGAAPGAYPNTTGTVSAIVGGIPTTSPAATDRLDVAGPGLSKQFIPNVAAPGNTVSLEFTITNSSTTAATTGMSFTDDLNAALPGMTASGLPLTDPCGPGSTLTLIGSTLNFAGGNLPPGGSCTFSVPVTVPISADGEYINATSPFSFTVPGPVSFTVAGARAPLTVLSGLSMTKSFANDPVYVGTTVDLQFTISNSDVSGTATGITFTDDLGAALSGLTAVGLPLADVCGAGSTLSGTSVITLSGGSLPAQSSCTFSVTLQVPYPINPWATVNNVTSDVSGNVGAVPTSGPPASDRLLLDFTPHADVTILKSGPPSIVPGIPAVYTITVTNNGPYDAQSVAVTDTPSPGLVFSSNTGDCLTAFPCSLGTIPGGASRVITSTFNVPSSVTGGFLSNTASVSSTTLDLVPGNNSSGTTAPISPEANLSVGKAGPSAVIPGSQAVYTITVTNNGPSDAPGVTLNDAPGTGLTFVSNTGACATAFPCSLGTIPAGGSAVVTSTFLVDSALVASPLLNEASVSSLVFDPDLGNNLSPTFANVTPQADVSVTKSGPATTSPGEEISYTITVRNNGPSVASAVTLADTPTAGLVFVSNTGSCTTGFPCSLGDIAVGATRTITSTFSLPSDLATNPITNTATVSSATSDPVPGNNSSTTSAGTPGLSDLKLLVRGPELSGGEDFSFGITLSNAGPSNATGILLQIVTSPGVTYIPGPYGSACAHFPCFIPTLGVNEIRNYTANFNLSGVTTSPMVTKIFVISSSIETDPSDNEVIISTATCPSATVDLLIPDGALDVPQSGALTWEAINADEYQVYFGPPGEGCTTLVGTTTAKSFPYTGLDFRVPYEWRVIATKAGCPSGAVSSACQKFTSGPPCPTEPPELIFPPQGGLDFLSPIRFEWSAVPAATAYRVWASIDGTPAVVLGETGPEATSLVYQIIPGAIEWWVEVLSGSCTPIQSPSQTFTSSGSCVTRPAVLTSPADGATLTSPVTFDWEPVGGAKSYSVWVSVDGKFPVVVASTTTETQATARVSSGELRWFVESRYDRCPPAISKIRTIIVPAGEGCLTHQPPELIEPTAGQRLLSPIEFRWTPVDEAIAYAVWAAIDGDSPSIIATTEGEEFVEQDLRAGQVEWFVQAIFDGCPSTESTQASFEVLEAGSCDRDAPTPLFPSSGTTITDPVVRFEWSRVAGAEEYRVWVYVLGHEPQLLTSTPATLDFAEERVPIGQLEWYVEALFPGCPSRRSAPVGFEVPPSSACATTPPTGFSPVAGAEIAAGTPVSFRWSAVPGAFDYRVWLVREGGSPSIVANTGGTSTSARVEAGQYTWYVEALLAGCSSLSSAPMPFSVSVPAECQNLRPTLLSPADGAVDLTSPITFVWTPVKGATGYTLWLAADKTQPYFITAPADTTELIVPIPTGVTDWYVEATVPGCSSARSTTSQFRVIELGRCTLPAAPAASVVGEITTGEKYKLLWKRVAGSTIYEVQQTTTFNDALGLPDYTGSTVIPTTDFLELTAPELSAGQSSLKIYYRVRGIADCNQQRGPYGASVSIVVTTEDQSAQIGATDNVSRNLTLCADEAGNVYECEESSKRRRSSAEVTVDLSTTEEWLTVTPSSGTIPSGGSLTVTLEADPSQLPTGTSTAALVASTGGSSRTTSGSGGSVPVSIGLAAPVTPTGRTEPPPYAQIIPAVIHGDSATGTWQSDIRILNNASKSRKYQLNFTRSNIDGTTEGKQATVEIGAGKMMAFDDIVRSWYGAATTSLTGVLEIRATTPPSGGGSNDPSTVAASRTYNNTPFGSFGQFVPAVSFSKFIGSDGVMSNLLLLQQLSQSDFFRTNVGLVESSGRPATALISIFGPNGVELGQTSVSLKAGEHTQLNALLAQMGITAEDARAEVKVTSSTGRITAYASVVDARTLDPTFVPATSVDETASSRRVLPGVADFDTGLNRWRSDARIYNSGEQLVDATLTFYPQGSPEQSVTRTIAINPKSIRALNDLLRTEFGLTNTGGALHVTTTNPEPLIVTARTYDQREDGTVGQFIPSLTTADASSLGGRVLNLLQVEESDRTRTNLGLVELSGEGATVEVTAVVPASLAAPKIRVSLRPYEFIQLGSIFRQFGFQDVFNGRLYVRVVEGSGKVGAYASAIDNATGDPAYVPAQ